MNNIVLEGHESILIEDGLMEHPEVSLAKAQEPSYKDNWQEFKKILKENNVNHLYHFTDLSNIKSIKENGGLYSWWMAEKFDISITNPGGDGNSRRSDRKYKLENYVRLSFCKEHPMIWGAVANDRIVNPFVLEINPEVVFFEETVFSDMNATKTGHSHGGLIEDVQKIKFDIVKKRYFDVDESNKPYYQAEVLVRSFIPYRFITGAFESTAKIKQPPTNYFG